ncbi:MAG: SusC/RagA family TonB-linked outer membrane protein [Duncaniella sp.]|nr:SusC/RagA family TonB-linked outer membrane protein [Duncaniella sp.]
MLSIRNYFTAQGRMMRSMLCVIVLLMGSISPAQVLAAAESVVAKGLVTDVDGEPLPGATVAQEGSTNAVATNVDGEYSITVPRGSRLVVSYIGKNSETVTVNESKTYNVVLYDNETMLDEVMITGYATISKAQSTGSFQKISGETLQLRRMDNLSDILDGTIAGYVDGKIRGITTMNAIANPLVVIDGFPVENASLNRIGQTSENMPDLNPEDIESVTVLKDAAAASIYGARAANGVIVITTKKAMQGRPEVSFSATFTTQKYSQYVDNRTNSADMIALERKWAAQYPDLVAGGESAGKVADDLRLGSLPSQGVSTLLDMYTGAMSMDEGNARLNALATLGYNYYDQVKEYGKRNPFHQQYNLRVAQSSDRNSFNASATFWKHSFDDVNHDDHSLGINITDQMKVADWLTADFGAYIKYGRENLQNYNLLSPGYNFLPYDGLVAADGSYISAPAQGDANRRETIEQYGMVPEVLTPMKELDWSRSKAKSLDTRVFAKLRFDFTSWLNYNIQFQYETGNTDTDYLQNRYSYDVVSMLNNYVTQNQWSGALQYNLPEGDVMYRTAQKQRGYDFRHQLNFNYRFGDLHNLLVFLGQEVRDNRITYTDNTYFGYDPELLSWMPYDQDTLSYYFSALLGASSLNMTNLESMKEISNRFVSFYGNASYSLADKYNLTGSLRWDRSNLWGTSSKYQNKPIWSVGASWNINRESFFKEVDWVDNLQVRASYGIGGNIGRNTAPYMTASYFPGSLGTTGMVIAPPNKDIRWEKTTTINVGVDFDLFRNRMWGSIDYYLKRSTDLLAIISGSPTQGFGYSTLTTNNGAMNNSGIELNLSGQIIRNSQVTWTSTLLYALNHNKVKSISVQPSNYDSRLTLPTSYPTIGNPYNALYAYRWAGISPEGEPQIYDAEGNVTTDDVRDVNAIVYSGTTVPVHSGSFNNVVRWKGLEFSAMITFAFGHKVRETLTPAISMASGRLSSTNKDIMNAWTKPGDEAHTDVPRLLFSNDVDNYNSYRNSIYRYSDLFIYDASNIRIRDIGVSYILPADISRKAYMRLVKFRFSLENVATIAMDSKAHWLLGGKQNPNVVFGLNLGF